MLENEKKSPSSSSPSNERENGCFRENSTHGHWASTNTTAMNLSNPHEDEARKAPANSTTSLNASAANTVNAEATAPASQAKRNQYIIAPEAKNVTTQLKANRCVTLGEPSISIIPKAASVTASTAMHTHMSSETVSWLRCFFIDARTATRSTMTASAASMEPSVKKPWSVSV